jgi:deoxycytidylate deaminase
VAWIRYGKTVIWGRNSNKTSPHAKREFEGGESQTIYRIHAEQDCLNRCPDPQGQILYVVRPRRDGTYGMAKPCPDCQQALRAAGIKAVLYTDEHGTWQQWRP